MIIKKLTLIFLLIVLASTKMLFGQTPFKQSLAGIATLDFPEQPNRTLTTNGRVNGFKVITPQQRYNAITIPIDTTQTPISTSTDLDLFYSGIVEGASVSTELKKLIYTKQITVGKYKGVEFKVLNTSNQVKSTAYYRAVYLEQTLFMYNFMMYDEPTSALDAERERFLNSFTVTKTTAKQL